MSSCTVHKLNHKYKVRGSRAFSLSDLRIKIREGHYNLDYPKFAGVKEDAVTLKVGCGQIKKKNFDRVSVASWSTHAHFNFVKFVSKNQIEETPEFYFGGADSRQSFVHKRVPGALTSGRTTAPLQPTPLMANCLQ